MPKTISFEEAAATYDEITEWITENNDRVIVTVNGQPAVVVLPYGEYEEMKKLRKRQQKRKILEALEALRKEVREHNPDITAEKAYRLAGFSEKVIEDTLKSDIDLNPTTSP